MGKKKTYKLSEHEQQHNRVDYFRSIQIPKNAFQPDFVMSTTHLPRNDYSNPTFIASNNDLTFPNRTRQNVWSTSNSYLASENSVYNIKNTNLKGQSLNDKKRKNNNLITRKSTNKRCIIITLIVIAVILVVCAAIGLGLAYNYYWKPKSASKSCYEECTGNKYCVTNQNKDLNSTCTCKPGYQLNLKTNKCDQRTCYTGYFPYTYINDNSPQTPAPYDTQFTRPYCCPNGNYLTNSCCGMSTISDSSLTVSKRIIGGQKLNSGVFPWIVFVTQVYRSSINQPLRMIKNCSGTLLNERYVLTAAHCLDVDRNIFNGEFTNIASMTRVYFGFVNKKQLFSGNMREHERRIQRVIYHPKYDQSTLRNDLVILKLDQPVYRNVNTDYLCLNSDTQDNLVAKLYTAGWGSTNPSHLSLSYPDQINYVDAVVFPMTFCKYIYPDPAYDFLFNQTTHVCAGYQAAVGKDTCYSDSGSPLMVQKKGQWFAYGVVTFGSQPDCAQGPSMFIRVSFYYNWIKSIISF